MSGRGRLALGAIALIAVAGATWLTLARRSSSAPDAALVERVVPEATRIKVEVLNASGNRGLARRAVATMRDAGFDVVYFGNSAERTDSSIVRDRSGHPDWATLAARIMAAKVENAPDSSHFLDLTVLVGRNWVPPREPLRP